MRTKSKRGEIMVETSVFYDGKAILMRYHKTAVAAMYPSDMEFVKVELDTGGFFTSTTKKRMNQFAEMFGLDFAVYQQHGQWIVQLPGQGSIKYFEGNTCSFTITKA